MQTDSRNVQCCIIIKLFIRLARILSMISANYTLNIEKLQKFINIENRLKKLAEPVSFKCLLLITLWTFGPKKIAALLVIFLAKFKVFGNTQMLSEHHA